MYTERLVGVTFDGCQERLRTLPKGDRVYLAREPENEYDINAIRCCNSRGESLGYIRKELAATLNIAGHLHVEIEVYGGDNEKYYGAVVSWN